MPDIPSSSVLTGSWKRPDSTPTSRVLCAVFYAARMGRPSLRPGRYFRMLFIGYFEGLSSERGIAWRVSDSLSLRSFLDLDVTAASPGHSTLSRTRRLIDVTSYYQVKLIPVHYTTAVRAHRRTARSPFSIRSA